MEEEISHEWITACERDDGYILINATEAHGMVTERDKLRAENKRLRDAIEQALERMERGQNYAGDSALSVLIAAILA